MNVWEVEKDVSKELYLLRKELSDEKVPIVDIFAHIDHFQLKYSNLYSMCFNSTKTLEYENQLHVASFMIGELTLKEEEEDYPSYWLYEPLNSVLLQDDYGDYYLSPILSNINDDGYGVKLTRDELITTLGSKQAKVYRRLDGSEEEVRILHAK